MKIFRILMSVVVAGFVGVSCTNNAFEEIPSGTNHGGNGGTNNNGGTPDPGQPSGKSAWAELADSCTFVLVDNFLNKKTGTFWSTPNDIEKSSTYIYWQQAHALDVILYSYQRIKDSDQEKAAVFLDYINKWYENDANNYNNSKDREGDYGGFYNDYTDDMCWICLTLIRMTEFTGDDKFITTAKDVFDKYIWPRATESPKGISLPWTTYDQDKNNKNACTNAPACLTAVLLYNKYKTTSYLDIAKKLYDFNIKNMPDAERVEEPPLTYTQGTFGEACRQLYHVTGDKSYMDKAGKVLYYAVTSNRTTDTSSGLLRHEGTSMDQSLFKAVYVPYAVNYVLDEKADSYTARAIKEKLLHNATALSKNLDRKMYPRMYADYFWGTTFTQGTASMGAQASGASLMEGVARMTMAQ
jgi:predicted alpha-1,6-mannanase (GH76 family)